MDSPKSRLLLAFFFLTPPQIKSFLKISHMNVPLCKSGLLLILGEKYYQNTLSVFMDFMNKNELQELALLNPGRVTSKYVFKDT